MTTRKEIIQLADNYIRDKGYNAFSFNDISKNIGIKTASVHYHFPTKSDLGVAVIDEHIDGLKQIIEKYKSKSPLAQLDKLLAIYARIKADNKVCLVGTLATDLNTVDEQIKTKIHAFTSLMIAWVSDFLEEGRNKNIFRFEGLARTKAMMTVGSLLAIVQLSRITGDEDFSTIQNNIKNELLNK